MSRKFTIILKLIKGILSNQNNTQTIEYLVAEYVNQEQSEINNKQTDKREKFKGY
jgi:hypothetical protein